jgi:hypothetical protein
MASAQTRITPLTAINNPVLSSWPSSCVNVYSVYSSVALIEFRFGHQVGNRSGLSFELTIDNNRRCGSC